MNNINILSGKAKEEKMKKIKVFSHYKYGNDEYQ
jgi:hypothetical protein